tara:strand:- start:1725 stop:2753 length:1029 start_codon:yes stop_codon:yes gene_type:complete
VKYREFPKNKDIKVSEVGFGVWSVATNWWGVKDEKMAIDLLQYASDRGVNFYDTADVYGLGYGETILPKAFPDSRDKRVYATKFGYDIDSGVLEERTGHSELRQKFLANDIRYSCEQSLKRLKTDYIDIYQLHNPRLDFINGDEVVDTLEALIREGKIRSYAMALGPDIGWLEEGIASMDHNPIALHVIYNLLEQEPMKFLFDKARETNTGLMIRVPHASGLLDGSITEKLDLDKDDHRSHRKRMWIDAGVDVLRDFDFLLEHDRTIGQAAILFALAEKSACSVFPNFTKRAEIDEFCATSDLKELQEEELKKIDDLWIEKHAKMLTSLVFHGDSSNKPTPR